MNYKVPTLPLSLDLESKAVMRQLTKATRKIAELKGVAQTIPNEGILINSLTLQEAKDSSEVEQVVTTNDELYRAELDMQGIVTNASTKEVLRYREALKAGFEQVRSKEFISLNDIIRIQECLVENQAGLRRQPGTVLRDARGNMVYTPPQDPLEVEALMVELERYINTPELDDLDPLVKLAVIHHQFESIHPFLDGNGRTGRILCILYLILTKVLDLPIIYLSRYITHHKAEYYRLIQLVRDQAPDNASAWEEWVLFILSGVEQTADETIALVKEVKQLMGAFKEVLRSHFGKQYKHEMLNNLFFHPYTKIEFFERDMMISRSTAIRYLDRIVELGLLHKVRFWRTNYYVNTALCDLFLKQGSSS